MHRFFSFFHFFPRDIYYIVCTRRFFFRLSVWMMITQGGSGIVIIEQKWIPLSFSKNQKKTKATDYIPLPIVMFFKVVVVVYIKTTRTKFHSMRNIAELINWYVCVILFVIVQTIMLLPFYLTTYLPTVYQFGSVCLLFGWNKKKKKMRNRQ